MNLHFLRFHDEEIKKDMDAVVGKIKDYITAYEQSKSIVATFDVPVVLLSKEDPPNAVLLPPVVRLDRLQHIYNLLFVIAPRLKFPQATNYPFQYKIVTTTFLLKISKLIN